MRYFWKTTITSKSVRQYWLSTASKVAGLHLSQADRTRKMQPICTH
jgi:hypothetical protein